MNEENKRSEEDEMPLVTFALFAYNQEQYIREAVEAALAQTYENLEIIVSDDASPDKTYEIMQECVAEYRGSHKIILNRNEVNLGIGGHVNKVFDMSRGEIIVMAAGDDISTYDRTEMIVKEFATQSSNTILVYSNGWRIDEAGTRLKKCGDTFGHKPPYDRNLLMSNHLYVIGAFFGFKRELLDKFGRIHEEIQNEDVVLMKRTMLCGRAGYIDKCLVSWRVTSDSLTDKTLSYMKTNDKLKRRLGAYAVNAKTSRQLIDDIKAQKNEYEDLLPILELKYTQSQFFI